MNQNQPENTVAPEPLRWRLRRWFFRELFAAEYTELNHTRRLAALLAQKEAETRQAFEEFVRGRRARFVLEAGLSEEEAARRLAGTAKSPVVEAVMSLVDRKIMEMSDRATNPPSATNPADLRTYESGGANAIAEFKTRLQELTAAKDADKEAA